MTGKVESVAFEICASGITHDSLSGDIVAGHCEWSHVEPIPLTEEWLVKFGFKPLVKDWQIKGLIIHARKRGFVVNNRIPILKTVHQLQNLYFALTGEELTLKQ
jgi:hypothetical protein